VGAVVEGRRRHGCRIGAGHVRNAAGQVDVERRDVAVDLCVEFIQVDSSHFEEAVVAAVGEFTPLSFHRDTDAAENVDVAGRRRIAVGAEHHEATVDDDHR